MLLGAPPAAVYALAVLAASAVTLTRPAQASALSSLVDRPDELTAATAVSGWMDAASALGGPALAGLLIALDGPGVVFVGVRRRGHRITAARRPAARPGARRALPRSTRTSRRLTRASSPACASSADDPAPRALVAVIAAEHLAIGALDVLVVVLAVSTLGLGAPAAGYLNGAFGLGATVGGILALGLVGARSLSRPVVAAAVAWGVAFVALGLLRTVPAAFLLLPVAGICQALVDTGGRALLARVTPHAVLARVFGALEGVTMAALAAGSLLVSVLVAAGGVRLALIGVAAVLVAAVLLPLATLRAVARAVPGADAMRLLRGHELFSALPAPVLEGLARELEADPVRDGRVVIAEGAAGDRFYLIADGRFEVSVAGSFLRFLGPGDGFGEIALLRDVPRTATVTAVADGLLYGLERRPFLDALRPAI